MAKPPNPSASDTMVSASLRRRRKIAITNVRVFRENGLSKPCTVVISDDGLIGASQDGADMVDGEGGVLLPGLIDAHVHLHHEGHLRELTRYGVTTGLDMATWPADKMNGLRGREGLTDIRSAGLPATAPGSIHSCMLPLPEEALLSGPEDAASWVEKRIREGSDYIKLIADVPGPSQDTLNALAAAAQERKKLVVAHASAIVPFRMALEAQVDVITHVPRDKAVDQDTAERMVTEKRVSVPTLAMMAAVSKPPGVGAFFQLLLKPTVLLAIIRATKSNPHARDQKYENARDSVTVMYRAGVPILAGTDCHEEPNSPFSVKHGDSLHRELELLVEAGLSPIDAIRAATSLPALHFGLHDRGVIEEGKRADLVLISENPLTDIRATRSIKRVWCGGVEFTQS